MLLGLAGSSAMEAVQRWRFDPARRRSEPVAVWVLIPVEFTLQLGLTPGGGGHVRVMISRFFPL